MGSTQEVSTLVLNTCSRAAELALFTDSGVVVERAGEDLGSAEVLSVLLENVLKGKGFSSISKIVFFSGPGSYTGLRVGSAFCRGLSLGLNNISCLSISTFLALTSTIDVFDGFLGLILPASSSDVFYCEFKNSDTKQFWIPEGEEFKVIEIANLERFTADRKDLLGSYQSRELVLDLATSREMFEGQKLRKILNLEVDKLNWCRHLTNENAQELLYLKPVAAKTLEERKVVIS